MGFLHEIGIAEVFVAVGEVALHDGGQVVVSLRGPRSVFFRMRAVDHWRSICRMPTPPELAGAKYMM